jgi:hypothetical protein
MPAWDQPHLPRAGVPTKSSDTWLGRSGCLLWTMSVDGRVGLVMCGCVLLLSASSVCSYELLTHVGVPPLLAMVWFPHCWLGLIMVVVRVWLARGGQRGSGKARDIVQPSHLRPEIVEGCSFSTGTYPIHCGDITALFILPPRSPLS